MRQWTADSGQTEAEWQHDAKETAICRGCRFFDSKVYDTVSEDLSQEEIDYLVDEIADIVKWENAGIKTEWSAYDFATRQLVVHWRDMEADVKRLHETRMQVFLKAWMKG